MPEEDAIRWNERYRSKTGWETKPPLRFLTENIAILPKNGLALDIAMGAGRNAGVLLNHGLRVIGIDISFEAVLLAKRQYPHLSAMVADLAHPQIPPLQYDVIINFYFLQRELLNNLSHFTKPGGYVMIETLTQKIRAIRPQTPEAYLLGENELPQYFNENWRIVKYQEGWVQDEGGKQKAIASIIAKYQPKGRKNDTKKRA
ncbi:MAG: class I SAM-dependent methyltransferase [Anaerolineaceae bacterium]|nr:class I SAM-dependent methyltransferase [Anaerolineaceae bacterium]